MDATTLGETGLIGWREKVADKVAPPVAARTPLADEHVRAAIGALFFGLSVYYIASTFRRAVREGRGGRLR